MPMERLHGGIAILENRKYLWASARMGICGFTGLDVENIKFLLDSVVTRYETKGRGIGSVLQREMTAGFWRNV